MIKDDSHIINEWIIHNIINLGFDHIYIYDDQSIVPIKDTINILPENIKNKVTVLTIENNINFYDISDFKNSALFDMELYVKCESTKQIYFHNHFLKNYQSEWCFLCDVDEFIYLKDNVTVDDILNDEKYTNHDIIFIPWLVYGSSFNIEQPEGLVINNFKYHSNKYSEHGKSFYKMNKINYITNPHFINTHDVSKSPVTFCFNHNEDILTLPIHINHYQINSLKLYIRRKIRSEIGYVKGKIRDANEIFLFVLSNNDIYSDIMSKFSDNINNILNVKDSKIEDNLNSTYCNHSLYHNDNLIFSISSYDQLLNILNSDNVKFPKFENLLPSNFNVKDYRKLNKDLNKLTDIELMNHYVLFGKNENRKFFSLEKIKKIKKKSVLKKKKLLKLRAKNITKNNYNYDTSDYESVDLKKKKSIPNKDNNKDKEKPESESESESEKEIFKIINIQSINKNQSLDSEIEDFKRENKNEILDSESEDFKKENTYETTDSDISDFDKLSIEFDNLPNDFDPEVYKNINKDLENISNIDAINHYINFGKKEKRFYREEDFKKYMDEEKNKKKLNKDDDPLSDFDVKIYKELNYDLQQLSDQEAIEHFIVHGIKEKRKYKIYDKDDKDDPSNPSDFDPKIYKELNKDLENLTDQEAIVHYISHGMEEKRKYKKDKIVLEKDDKGLPNDFDVKMYKELNRDLKTLSDEKAIEHYINNGIKEKRKYKKETVNSNELPDDFDPQIYKKMNKDLEDMTDQQATKHYLSFGKYENRKYLDKKREIPSENSSSVRVFQINTGIPDDFDPNIYKKLNSDLKMLTNDQAIQHYLNNGIKEKRKYK
jgi:hypothetical protein